MDTTHISIGKRVEKTFQNIHGWQKVDTLPKDEVCVLVLGGSGTNDDEKANGYAKTIRHILDFYHLKNDVSVYSVCYKNTPILDDRFIPFLIHKVDREALFIRHFRSKVKPVGSATKELIEKVQKKFGDDALSYENPEIENPPYIRDLFEKTILPRISENGQRLSIKEACSRIRKLNIVTHCQGAYVFLKMEELMEQTLKNLGYSKEESLTVQSQLLCISHSPFAPLGVSKCAMISFGSASDKSTWHQNNFHAEVQNLNMQGLLPFCYFAKKRGELFLAPSVTQIGEADIEHAFVDYITPRYDLSFEGDLLNHFSTNALIGGLKGALAGQMLPDVKTLVCSGDQRLAKIFDDAEENGRLIYQKMSENVKLKHQTTRFSSR